jgi:hypothetical protein
MKCYCYNTISMWWQAPVMLRVAGNMNPGAGLPGLRLYIDKGVIGSGK